MQVSMSVSWRIPWVRMSQQQKLLWGKCTRLLTSPRNSLTCSRYAGSGVFIQRSRRAHSYSIQQSLKWGAEFWHMSNILLIELRNLYIKYYLWSHKFTSNKALKKVFWPKRDKVSVEWRILHFEKLYCHLISDFRDLVWISLEKWLLKILGQELGR